MGWLHTVGVVGSILVASLSVGCAKKPLPFEATATVSDSAAGPVVDFQIQTLPYTWLVVTRLDGGDASASCVSRESVGSGDTGKRTLRMCFPPSTGARFRFEATERDSEGPVRNARTASLELHVDAPPGIVAFADAIRCMGPDTCELGVEDDLSLVVRSIAASSSIEYGGKPAADGDAGKRVAPLDFFAFVKSPIEMVYLSDVEIDVPLAITFPSGRRLDKKVHFDGGQVRRALDTRLFAVTRAQPATGGFPMPGDDRDPEGRRAVVVFLKQMAGVRHSRLVGSAKAPSEIDLVAYMFDRGLVPGASCTLPGGGQRPIGRIDGDLVIHSRRTGKVVAHEYIKPSATTCPEQEFGALAVSEADGLAWVQAFLAKPPR